VQARGRMTAAQLAAELEVSPRTVLRDVEALSAAGIRVYAVRGSQGGFELIDGFRSDLPAAASTSGRGPAAANAGRSRGPAATPGRGQGVASAPGRSPNPAAAAGTGKGAGGVSVQRARVRLSPRGRRLAALLGRPSGIRVRRSPHVVAGREDWVEAWVRDRLTRRRRARHARARRRGRGAPPARAARRHPGGGHPDSRTAHQRPDLTAKLSKRDRTAARVT
jgi:DNA binding protein with HTH domain